jgi:N-methylhydantoinase A
MNDGDKDKGGEPFSYKIGVDVGGTFTDFLMTDQKGRASVFKILSTPEDPSVAVMKGFSAMAEACATDVTSFLGRVEIIVHGTTVTTNAVLTGNTAKTGLLTTRGFRDALQMRRGIREEPYNNRYLPPSPIVPRYLRVPVTERTDQSGSVLTCMDVRDVEEGADLFRKNGIEAAAICFMHSYVNNSNETAALERLRDLMPDAYLSVSSRILPQVRFYDRTSTTVLNAAVGPILKRYLSSLTSKLEAGGFKGILLIMQSNGGVTSPEVVTDLPASTLLSGPAAAPVAGIAYTNLHGVRDFITVDMGGTSFDAALIKDSQPLITTEGRVNRHALALPMMDINTIGAGGGSIAWLDEGGLLRMGPKSAGAKPGPVCYGLGGTEPTCSDANLVLGYLNEDYFAGGRIRLDRKGAEKAIRDKIADPLRMDTVAAAYGMCQIMNVNMASAIREISVQKGFDPREFLLVCAGGAGPIHAAMIAAELEIPRILIPKESSIFCAAGMLLSDLKHDFVRTYHTVLSVEAIDPERIRGLVNELLREGDDVLAFEGIPADRRVFKFLMDLRYLRQYHEVSVAVDRDWIESCREDLIREAFHVQHERLYGYCLKEEGTDIELVNIRMTAVGLTDKPVFRKNDYKGRDPSGLLKGRRPVFIPSRKDFQEVAVYDGNSMGFGHSLRGPAVIEQVNTTIFVPPEYEISCDEYGSYLMSAV